MRAITGERGLAGLILGAVVGLAACGGGGGGSGGDGATFAQPTAGVVVATGAASGDAATLLSVMSGDTSASDAVAAGSAEGTGTLPAITAVDRSSAHPFQRLTLSGSGFRTSGAAISVVFRAGGLPPVAVPAISATASRVEVVAPPLFSAGANVAGHVTLQVVQVGAWGHSSSDLFDGLDVSALPTLDDGVKAGAVLHAYLQATTNQLDYFLVTRPGALPASYWTAAAAQRDALAALRDAVQQVVDDPTATPAVATTGGSGSIHLNAATLAIADRLVAGMLLQIGPGLGLTTSGTLPAVRASDAVAQPPCPENTTEKWTDDFICGGQRYGFTVADLGAKLVNIGAQFEAAISLGLFGGLVTNGLAAAGSQAEVAFELTWAGLSGHISAWATAAKPPSAGETLADVSVPVVERLVPTYGVLGAMYTTLALLKEIDGQVIASQPTPPPPPVTNPWAGTWSGTYHLNITNGCTWHHSGGMLVNVNGTPGAYTGDFVMGGVQVLNDSCGLDSVMTINGDLDSVTTSGTTFTAVIPDPELSISVRGTLSGKTVTGTLTTAAGSGTFSITRQ